MLQQKTMKLTMHTPACMASMFPPIVSMVGFSIIYYLIRWGLSPEWHISTRGWQFITGAYIAIMLAQAGLLAAHVWMCHIQEQEPAGTPWLLMLASPGANVLVSTAAVLLYTAYGTKSN